jgi:hypothetical protein
MNQEEKKLNQKLKAALRGDYLRVENGVAEGVPDINICYQGCEVWIESKIVLPQGVLLRKHQFAWGVRRTNAGGMVFVIAWEPLNHYYRIWKFKDIDVEKCGEYLKISSQATWSLGDNEDQELQKLLFDI